MIAFTCPHCGGAVHYDISTQDVHCEYCDSLITLDEYQAYLDKKSSYQAVELTCPQCGAVTLSYDNTIATFCSYCGSSVVFDKRVKEEQKPDGMLPFTLSAKEARKRYRGKTGAFLLAPDWIRQEGELQMTGLYVPFYQYGARMSQPGRFKASISKNRGKYTEVQEYQITGTVQADYQGNRFDAAMAFPDAMSEAVDSFDWKKAVPFQPGYVAGFYADGSDVEETSYDEVAMRLIRDDINQTSLSYQGMRFSLQDIADKDNVLLERKKVLYPIWLLTHRVKDRICYAVVNGQNGDVAADVPLDKGRFVKVSLILAALFSLILNSGLTIKPQAFLWISMILTGLFGAVLDRLVRDVYVRENHWDDIGRVGYESFASTLKRSIWRGNNMGESTPRRPRSAGRKFLIGLGLFFLGPFAAAVLESLFPQMGAIDLDIYLGFLIFVLILHFLISGTVKVKKFLSSGGSKTRWRFSVPRMQSFSALWKIWFALAAGGAVLVSKTVEDLWYYGAGALNILVCLWSAFDLIKRQNRLASRDIPVFTMKRGGRE